MKQRTLVRQSHDERVPPNPALHTDSTSPAYLSMTVPAAAAGTDRAAVARQLGSVVGNRAVQRLIAPPVQRLWDDITESVEEWFTDEPAEAEADTSPPPTTPTDLEQDATDAEFPQPETEPAEDPAFQDAAQDAVVTAASGGSWLDDLRDWLTPDEEPTPQPEPDDEQRTPPECAPLEEEIRRLTERMQELYAISEAMYGPLLKAKQQYEALAASLPEADPRVQKARTTYQQLQLAYDQVLNEFQMTMDLRDAQRHVLEACSRAWGPKPPDVKDEDLIS